MLFFLKKNWIYIFMFFLPSIILAGTGPSKMESGDQKKLINHIYKQVVSSSDKLDNESLSLLSQFRNASFKKIILIYLNPLWGEKRKKIFLNKKIDEQLNVLSNYLQVLHYFLSDDNFKIKKEEVSLELSNVSNLVRNSIKLITAENDENEICTICIENPEKYKNEFLITNCGHLFCSEEDGCINSWILNNFICPACPSSYITSLDSKEMLLKRLSQIE